MSTLHGEYRRHHRTLIKTAVGLNMNDNALAGRTKDVSESGISIEKPSDLNLAAGQVVNVTFNRMPHLKVPARIVRVSDNDIGLELEYLRFSEQDIEGIVRTAPLIQRVKTRVRKASWQFARRAGVLLINTVLKKPLLAFIKPKYLFAVYGNERDVETYFTPLMSKIMPRLIICGFISNRGQRGLLVGSNHYERELATNPDKVRDYMQMMEQEYPNIDAIALVGRLPNFVMKAGIPIKDPLVDGSTGTRFMIWDVARKMREQPEYSNERTITVLGGAGRIGNKVCEDLAKEYNTVIAFDARYEQPEEIYTPTGKIIRTNEKTYLGQSKLFIGLTHHGDVVTEFMEHIPPGSLIADDTHPCISIEVRKQLHDRGIGVKKTVLCHKEFNMWPRLPTWSNRSIPGCLMETLVVVERKDGNASDFNWFKDAATEMGFEGQLVKPLDT